ncbi:MAG TPA: hypothetical protein VGE41_08095 [Verrucomicrobiae bacterium]|jgi:hypothetical protein
MKNMQRTWLQSVPWTSVIEVNQAHCHSKKCDFGQHAKKFEAARQLWEKNFSKSLSLADALEVCRKACDLAPFVFHNGNTFAQIAGQWVEPWAATLHGVEAQMLRTTVCHYVAGQISKKEMTTIFSHLHSTWEKFLAAENTPAPVPMLSIVPEVLPEAEHARDRVSQMAVS